MADDENWIKLAATTRNVVAFLAGRHETASRETAKPKAPDELRRSEKECGSIVPEGER